MKFLKAWFMGVALCGAVLVAVACGGRASGEGTDSNTHWLQACDADGDCGALSCICGTCTERCTADKSCAGFGKAAVCGVPSGCGAAEVTACVAQSSGGSGGSAGSGSASAGATASGGSLAQADCAAMDARSGQDVCLGNLGYAWDGEHCRMIQCDCQGADCGSLFPSADACDHAYRACYEASGLLRACATHADCVVSPRYCCESCSQVDDPGQVLMALASGSPTPKAAGVCIGDPGDGCDPCSPFQERVVYPACIEGECRLLDLSAHAHCETDTDCRLTTRDCCECNGDFNASGLVAVDASFVRPDYCPSDLACDECAGGPPRQDARASCQSGVCAVVYLPF